MERITENTENVALGSEQGIPPVPIQTYRWEDIRRSKLQGGYPWTHLMKPPFDPNEPQEIIEYTSSPGSRRRHGSFEVEELDESPKSSRKDISSNDSEEVLQQDEVEITSQEIGENEENKDTVSTASTTKVSFSDLEAGTSEVKNAEETEESKVCDLQVASVDVRSSPKSILKRAHPEKMKISKVAKNSSTESEESPQPQKGGCCHPLVDKLKTMADKNITKQVKALTKSSKSTDKGTKKHDLEENIKSVHPESLPKEGIRESPSLVMDLNKEEMLEIIELEESPSTLKKRREQELMEDRKAEEDAKHIDKEIPTKIPRKTKDHIYEDIEDIILTGTPSLVNEDGIVKLVLPIIDNDLNLVEEHSPASREIIEQVQLIIDQDSNKYDDMEIEGDENLLLQETIAITVEENYQKEKAPLTTMDSSSLDDDTNVVDKMPIVQEESESADENNTGKNEIGGVQITEITDEESDGEDKSKENLEETTQGDEYIQDQSNEGPEVVDGILKVEENNNIEEAIDEQEITSEQEKTVESEFISKNDKNDKGVIDEQNFDEQKTDRDVMLNEVDVDITDTTNKDDKVDEDMLMREEVTSIDKEHIELKEETSPASEKKVTFDENEEHHANNGRWSKLSDHEYEPIGQPPPEVAVTQPKDSPRRESDVSSTTSAERNLLRIALENDAIANDDHEFEEKDTQGEISVQEMQKQLEDRFFVNTPTTTESRTDCEINTSQIDSSGLEDLPLRRGSRKKGAAAEYGRNMQQKLRSHAGKLRTKIKNIKKPNLHMPDRPKFERPKFNFPDRPKFTKPEFPKFSKPSMSKFSFPDRPKFKMPERPKINFPSISLNRHRTPKERPSSSESSTHPGPKKIFDFSTYPRIFDRSKKAKIDYVTSSPKAERAGTPPPAGFATVPKVSRKKGPVGARWINRFSDIKYVDEEPKNSQKYESDEDDMDSREDYNANHSLERRMREDIESRQRRDFEDRIMHVDEDYRLMMESNQGGNKPHQLVHQRSDESNRSRSWEQPESDELKKETYSNDSEEYIPKPKAYWKSRQEDSVNTEDDETKPDSYNEEPNRMNIEHENTPLTNQEERSSGSSSERRRQGVLEDFECDEIFLREKGISPDDIEVVRYLSSEIRDAFRTPSNALEQLDGFNEFYDEEVDVSNDRINEDLARMYRPSPDRPGRTAAKKNKHKLFEKKLNYENEFKNNTEELDVSTELLPQETEYFNTFPPSRPPRNKKSKAQSIESEDIPMERNIITDNYNENNRNFINYEQTNDNFDNSTYENDCMEGKIQPQIFITNGDTKKSKRSKSHEEDIDMADDTSGDAFPYEIDVSKNEMLQQEPPQPPKRRRKSNRDHSASEQGSIHKSQFQEDWSLCHLPFEVDDEIIVHRVQQEVIIPLAQSEPFPTPTPPRRVSRSRRSRSHSQLSHGNSLVDDDRTSHGADSLVSDINPATPLEEPRCILDLRDASGYAIVKKEPPPRPPAPQRKKRMTQSFNDRQFNTVPKQLKEKTPPARPYRNYSTLGPSRPPRRKSSGSIQDIDERKRSETSDGLDTTQYEELEDELDSHRELKSGEAISKIQGRPLPPPPRPPRGPRKGRDSTEGTSLDFDVPESDHASLRADTTSYPLSLETQTLNAAISHPSLQDDVIEIEVSTQTDPLPDDFCCEEFEITDDMKVISPTKLKESKSTQEALAEIERARKIADADSLARGLQRFRESSRQRTFSDRSRTPSERPRTPSERAISPTAMVFERRIHTPTQINDVNQTVTQATLIVQPLNDNLDLEEIKSVDKCKPVIPPFPKRASAVPKPKAPLQTQDIEPHNPEPIITSIGTEVEVLRTQHLQVTNLDVETLHVSQLQASTISVSEIDGVALQVKELNSKSGNLVVSGIEIAPGVLQDFLEKFSPIMQRSAPVSLETDETVKKSEISKSESVQPEEEAPERPPIPPKTTKEHIYASHFPIGQPPPGYYPYPASLPPPAFYTLGPPRDYSEDGLPLPPTRRRRHAPKPDSTSEEDTREPVARFKRHGTRSPEPSVGELSGQLVRAVNNSVSRLFRHLCNILSSRSTADDGKRELQMAIVVLLVLCAGLIMIGFSGGKAVHHHHWEFFNPPTDKN